MGIRQIKQQLISEDIFKPKIATFKNEEIFCWIGKGVSRIFFLKWISSVNNFYNTVYVQYLPNFWRFSSFIENYIYYIRSWNSLSGLSSMENLVKYYEMKDCTNVIITIYHLKRIKIIWTQVNNVLCKGLQNYCLLESRQWQKNKSDNPCKYKLYNVDNTHFCSNKFFAHSKRNQRLFSILFYCFPCKRPKNNSPRTQFYRQSS